MKKFYSILILLLSLSGNAQSDSTTVAIDSSGLKTISFSENLSEKYRGEEFDYLIKEGVNQNFLERFLHWLSNILRDMFGVEIPPGIQKLLTNLIYFVLLAFAVYYIVRLLVGKESVSFFNKKDVQVTPFQIDEEHIAQLDLDQLLSEALDDKNYRLAIRYLYLKTLKELTATNRIQFHAEKTNSDYLKEIEDNKIKKLFRTISYAYEYIWYGEFEIDQNGFNQAKSSFDQLTFIKP